MSDEKKPALSPEIEALVKVLTERFAPGYDAQQQHAREAMEAIYHPPVSPEMIPVRVPCVHPSGYRFTALVVPSKTFPAGRWVRIEDERWPTDEELCAYDPSWGRKPDRFMRDNQGRPDPNLGYTPACQLELYDNIRLPILKAVGGELPVDWREDMQERVKELRAAAAAEVAKMNAQLQALATTQEPVAPPKRPRQAAAPALPDPK